MNDLLNAVKVFFRLKRVGDTVDVLFGKQGVILDSWLHLAITWDGETKQVWIDGIGGAQQRAPIDIAADPVIIGGDLDGGTALVRFNGLIDDVRIYDRPLDADEISRLAEISTDP